MKASSRTLSRKKRHSPTILIVEDSEDDTLLIQYGFERVGFPFPLNFVTNGVDAVQYLCGRGPYADRKKFPAPCVLLTDLKMPRMNGFELLKWVRSQPDWHELPVVVITGSNQAEDRHRAISFGANFYVVKDLLLKPPPSLVEVLFHYAASMQAKPKRTLARRILPEN